MILHYLIIWQEGSNFQTRKETTMDLELETKDVESAEIRYQAIKEYLSETHNIHKGAVSIINVCRL